MGEAGTRSELLSHGLASFERRAWGDAYRHLREADTLAPLDPGQLETLSRAAFLLGLETESVDALARAHAEALERGEPRLAARCAVLAAFQRLGRGERAQGGGWLARARRVLDESGQDGPERGFVLALEALQRLGAGEVAAARSTFEEAVEIGRRHGDVDLMSLGRLGQGQALLREGDVARGLSLLDEVMIGVTADEVSPIFAGTIYCAVLEACHELHDLRRAREWSTALTRWCDSQPELVSFRGECLVRRAELMRVHGSWPAALEAAAEACDRLSRPPRSALGAALYQRAELHRLRGAFAEAEDAYRRASEAGRKPQPGLALLRLAQGNVRAAKAAVEALLEETRGRGARARILPACIEVLLEAGDVSGARSAAEELSAQAEELHAPLLRAWSAYAAGSVLLAEGEPRQALNALREALSLWAELEAPYEAARTRVLVGRACLALGDEDGSALEVGSAREAFERLGARTDLQRTVAPGAPEPAGPSGGLTRREIEVLRLVAKGKTNRAIATDLHISEKTVARHLSNIFLKLDLPSRSAATAFAYENGLV